MTLRSLAYRSDLIFARYDGLVEDRGDHLLVLTPGNPDFFWGNFLIFDRAPRAGDLARWEARFEAEVLARQPARHRAFGWDVTGPEPGEVGEFLAAGYELLRSVVLVADRVRRPPKYDEELLVRPLSGDADWEAALANQVACRDPAHAYEDYLPFKKAQMARYRRMAEEGRGWWFGGFLDGRLVADLGLYREGGLGRFQNVETLPESRRRGACGALVHRAARFALEEAGLEELVMVADEGYHAARIYESVGFVPRERQYGLERWTAPPAPTAASSAAR